MFKSHEGLSAQEHDRIADGNELLAHFDRKHAAEGGTEDVSAVEHDQRAEGEELLANIHRAQKEGKTRIY